VNLAALPPIENAVMGFTFIERSIKYKYGSTMKLERQNGVGGHVDGNLVIEEMTKAAASDNLLHLISRMW
jgi:hypothetical protein